MEIKDGGVISALARSDKDKIKSIVFCPIADYKFEMWINGDSLSYLSLEETIQLRDALNIVLKKSFNFTIE